MATNDTPSNKNWLINPRFDLAWIIGPPALSALAVVLLPTLRGPALPLWGWALCIVAIDVAHVWSTLYRTYLDPEERRRRAGLLLYVPLLCWAAGVLLYRAGGAGGFWRVFAYLAVFHFVRQQFGFAMLYRRAAGERGGLALDKAAIYATMLYPLAVWHAGLPRAFDWFMPGDFVALPSWTAAAARWAYAAVLAAWAGKELRSWTGGRRPNAGKILLILATAASWHVGIVLYDSDVAFTVTNVIAHGVPYFALVWAHGRRRWAEGTGWVARLHRPGWGLAGFLGLLLALAYVEEGLWDAFIWREHAALFGGLTLAWDGPAAPLALLVPLLALPQATHYVLDAWIWRLDGTNPTLEALLPRGAPGSSPAAAPAAAAAAAGSRPPASV
ncbi:MAG: hypothetical protein HY553_04780 [Elusimicrobia bacterium]|nr:hypothetical protein [Elusimicrobiota bacterium]